MLVITCTEWYSVFVDKGIFFGKEVTHLDLNSTVSCNKTVIEIPKNLKSMKTINHMVATAKCRQICNYKTNKWRIVSYLLVCVLITLTRVIEIKTSIP